MQINYIFFSEKLNLQNFKFLQSQMDRPEGRIFFSVSSLPIVNNAPPWFAPIHQIQE